MKTLISKHTEFETNRTTIRHLSRLASSVLGLLVLLWSQTAPAATITVTTAGDDLTPNDGSVSLREAITAINAGNSLGDPDIIAQNPGTFGINDTINFNIAGAGVQTINVGSNPSASGIALPTIIKPLTINGYTQGVASVNTLANGDNAVILIELNGTSAGAGRHGLTLGAGSAGGTIMGLAINRFAGNGIVVQSNDNTIIGNFIGTDPTGMTRMPNGTFPTFGDGILIQNASNNFIGTPAPADRNVVSGNSLGGIHIAGTLTTPATGNKIQGNFVGVAKNGVSGVGTRTEPAPAPGTTEGNNLYGIEISGGNTNTIGGTTAGARNVVGFNADGIEIDNGAQNNLVQGNFVGVGADGVTQVGNILHGIALRSSNGFSAPLGPPQPNEPGVSSNLIGGTPAGSGNLVEFNGVGGVAVFGNPVSVSGQPNLNNTIQGNSIFENGRNNVSPAPLGIDLTNQFVYPKDDGVTPNDSGGHGAANDPNDFQNFPVLTTATSSGGTTNIAGTLNSVPTSTFRIEFFASDPDALGVPAEGQQFLGFANGNTDANGNLSFNTSLIVPVANGRIVTATATLAAGNTSEFSAGLVVPTQLATPTPTPASQAVNLSTRMRVQTGDNVGIGGFIITGSTPKHVVLRAIGPSLTLFGVPDALADPVLELHGPGAFVTITNDNWRDTQEAQIQADGLAPSNDLESAIDATLAPGAYTGIVRGNNNTSGVGLIEVYDLNPSDVSTLANLSTRAFVSTGNNIVIAGFILSSGAGMDRIVVRGLGPSLTAAGVPNALADPTLELRDGNGMLLIVDNNWQDNAAQAAELMADGLAPTNPLESGIAMTLPPGLYTALLAGVNNGTGIGLVEVYDLGP
jgi:CSLREA domain-containing protein